VASFKKSVGPRTDGLDFDDIGNKEFNYTEPLSFHRKDIYLFPLLVLASPMLEGGRFKKPHWGNVHGFLSRPTAQNGLSQKGHLIKAVSYLDIFNLNIFTLLLCL